MNRTGWTHVICFLFPASLLAVAVVPASGGEVERFRGGNDDGLSPADRAAMQRSGTEPSQEVDRDVVIVHRSRPIAYFGFYRANMMTEPGWQMFERTVNWALDFKEPAESKVWLATSFGTLDRRFLAGGPAADHHEVIRSSRRHTKKASTLC